MCDNPSNPPPLLPVLPPSKSIAIELKGEGPAGGEGGERKGGGGGNQRKHNRPTPCTPLNNQEKLLMADPYSGHNST